MYKAHPTRARNKGHMVRGYSLWRYKPLSVVLLNPYSGITTTLCHNHSYELTK
jgi:hypothetical protein